MIYVHEMIEFQTTYALDGEVPLTHAVIEALATAQGVAPIELDPIYSLVDLEAVEQVILSVQESTDTVAPGHLRFTIDTYWVTIAFDGTITVSADETAGATRDDEAEGREDLS